MSLWSRVQRRLGDLAGELVLDEYREHLDRAERRLASGDAAGATELLEAVLVAEPNHGQALIALGDARLIARDPARAAAAYERALEVRPGDPAALVGHGLALVGLARHEAAITSLGRAVAEAAGDRGILADAYRGLGAHEEALTWGGQALGVAVECGYRMLEGQARTTLAEIHLAQADSVSAVAEADRALAVHRETGYQTGADRTRRLLRGLGQLRDR